MLSELLANAGLLRQGVLDLSRVGQMSLSDIVDFAQESAEISSTDGLMPAASSFVQSATFSLGGGRYPCGSLGCRSQRVKELVQFAALYSDGVFVNNLFQGYADPEHGIANAEEDSVRQDFAEDLVVLEMLRPLIDSGLVIPLAPPEPVCHQCFADEYLGGRDADRLDKIGSRLSASFLDELQVVGRIQNGRPLVEIDGPERLLEHSMVRGYPPLRAWYESRPRIRARLLRGEGVPVGKTAKRLIRLPDLMASEILRDVYFELALAQTMGASFLTERPIHLEIFGDLTEDEDTRKRNQIVQQHLTTMMPFVADVPPANLVRLREREGASFELFRQALTEAIDAVRERKTTFSEQDARQLYSDVLRPRLASLDNRVREGKQGLRVTSKNVGIAWAGAISFGVVTGLLPHDIMDIARGLGLVAASAAGINQALGKANVQGELRRDSMYFLWRARALGRG